MSATSRKLFPRVSVERELRRRVNVAGSQRQVAREMGVSDVFLSDVLRGRRGLSDRLIAELGYERVDLFRRIKRETP